MRLSHSRIRRLLRVDAGTYFLQRIPFVQYWYPSSGFLGGEGMRSSFTPSPTSCALGSFGMSQGLLVFWSVSGFPSWGQDLMNSTLLVRVSVLVLFLLLCRNPMTRATYRKEGFTRLTAAELSWQQACMAAREGSRESSCSQL